MRSSKILLVEDNETLLEVLKYNLAKGGYRVVSASDGIKALERTRLGKPAFI
jgi:CheY-like chemotaxis protein